MSVPTILIHFKCNDTLRWASSFNWILVCLKILWRDFPFSQQAGTLKKSLNEKSPNITRQDCHFLLRLNWSFWAIDSNQLPPGATCNLLLGADTGINLAGRAESTNYPNTAFIWNFLMRLLMYLFIYLSLISIHIILASTQRLIPTETKLNITLNTHQISNPD